MTVPLRARYFLIAFVATTLCLSCATRRTVKEVLQRKYAPQQLRADVSILQQVLEANHPSLYWYTPKDSMDQYFHTTLESITDSLTLPQFRNIISRAVEKIHCGHTAVRYPDEYILASFQSRGPQFPLSIKTWSDSLIVVAAAPGRDSLFKRGTIITSINGMTNRQLLDSMFQLIGTDGYANNFKSQLISFNFPAHYRNTFGIDSSYTIRYVDSSGAILETRLPAYRPPADSLHKPGRPPGFIPLTRKERKNAERTSIRSLGIDTALRTGYMRLTTFSSGNLRAFFRRSFRQLKQEQAQNLVIDLRENGGGSINVSTRLARYIANHPFKVADTVAAQSRRFRHGKYIHPAWIYWLSMQVTSHKGKDGRYHFGFYERHHFNPSSRNHFDGNVYILQGGFTFSAATMFISELKGQANVHTIGEETGGGNYGNSSVHLPAIELPNSKLLITLPMYRVVLDSTRVKNGRGVQPDIYVSPSSVDLRNGIDNKMQKVKDIILRSAQ